MKLGLCNCQTSLVSPGYDFLANKNLHWRFALYTYIYIIHMSPAMNRCNIGTFFVCSAFKLGRRDYGGIEWSTNWVSPRKMTGWSFWMRWIHHWVLREKNQPCCHMNIAKNLTSPYPLQFNVIPLCLEGPSKKTQPFWWADIGQQHSPCTCWIRHCFARMGWNMHHRVETWSMVVVAWLVCLRWTILVYKIDPNRDLDREIVILIYDDDPTWDHQKLWRS